MSIICFNSYAQKQTKYQYYGGHGCIDIDLKLYSDSTFLFTNCNAMAIPHCSKKKGAYLLYEDEIHLYEMKHLHFLIPFATKKYKETVLRKDVENIFLFEKEDIPKNDKGFTETYYTLHLTKRS